MVTRTRLSACLAAFLTLTTVPPLHAQGPVSPGFTPDSTLNWMAGGTVEAVERAGNTIYLGGEFRALAPRRNITGGFAVFNATTAAQAVLTPHVSGTVDAVASDGGYWYVAGRFARVGTESHSSIVRLSAYTGQIDSNFNVRVIGRVHALAFGFNPSGRVLYVGGEFAQVGVGVSLSNVPNLAALLLTVMGQVSLMPGFTPAPDGAVHTLAFTQGVTTQTLFVGGEFSAIGSSPRNFLAAVDPATGAALGWDPAPDGVVRALALTPDNVTLFAGGDFSSIGGATRAHVAALDTNSPTGASLPWNPAANAPVRSLVLSGLNIFAGGDFTLIGGLARARVALLNTIDGSAVSTFDAPADASVRAMALSGATLFVGGDFTSLAGQVRLFAGAVNGATGVLTDWHPALNDAVRSIATGVFGPFPVATVAVGGEFDAFGAVLRRNLAAISLETGDVLPWRPAPNGTVRALHEVAGTLYVGGDFTEINGQSRNRLAAFARPDLPLMAWNPNADAPVYALASLAAAGGGEPAIYAGGDFITVGGQPRAHIAALNASSGAPAPWAPVGGNGRVLDIHPTSTFIYAAGQFTTLGGVGAAYLVRLDPVSGVADAAWTPNPSAEVRSVEAANGSAYVGGTFATIGGQPRANLAAVDTATGAATGWQPNPNGAVNALHLEGTTLFAGGDFVTVGQSTSIRRRPRLVGLDTTVTGPDALYVTAFAPRWVGRILDLAYDVSGIVAAGDNEFDGEENEPVSRVAFFPRLIDAPPGVPSGLSAIVSGTPPFATVTLHWGGPVMGARPARYVLEAGTTAGGTQISAGIGVTGDTAVFTAVPGGTYYLRLRSQNAFGTSNVSAETALAVSVSCSSPVNPPSDMTATVAGSVVNLSWMPATGGTVASYRVEAGLTPGSSQYQVPLAASDTSYSVSVAPGVYYARVRALGPCGTSMTSNEVPILVGTMGPPAAPLDVVATATGGTVSITWTPTTTAALGYRLEAGSAPGTSNAAVLTLGATASFTAGGVPAGVYFIRVRTITAAGVGPASEEATLIVR